MKKMLFLAMLFLASEGAAVLSAQSAYDSKKVVDVMQTNDVSMKAISKAIKAGDFRAASDGFSAIAKASKTLLKMKPPKGSQADWDKLIGDLVDNSLKGADAAKSKDAATAKKQYDLLQGTKKAGHGEFDSD